MALKKGGLPRRRPGERPLWGATPVDAEVEEVHPVAGWVMLEELFRNTTYTVGPVVLEIARPYDRHTQFGRVLDIHPLTASDLGVAVGDEVVYREWSGGRWSMNGTRVLITQACDILAQVT
jgi:co-chaperonin GroES (HSP10)